MNYTPPPPESSVDILSESDITYEYATRGQRFLNFLIDNIIMRRTIGFLTAIVLGFVLGALGNPEFLYQMLVFGTGEYWIFAFTTLALNYFFYYTICERYFNGQTLGKLITGTKAVRLDGSPLTFKDALLRSLSRIVPFEAFSGFGIPWHDSWTDTTVIKKR